MKILITGASGFIGSFLVEEGLRQGMDTWAGVRKSSSRKYLADPRIHFAELDLEHKDILVAQLTELKKQMGGKWDYVVHAAGATKCRQADDFFRINCEGTKHLVEALQETDMTPTRFVFISSLSVFGAIREHVVNNPIGQWMYSPILTTDTPQPNTAYGKSKLKAEEFLASTNGFPYIIMRPTGVYGPRERDYFMMADSIRHHIDFAVGYRPQEITFIYVKDLVQAVFLSFQNGMPGSAYFLSDGAVYNSRTFSDLLQQRMKQRFVLHIKAPLWFLKAICSASQLWCNWRGTMSVLNADKYNILSQRNWQCDIEPAQRELGYRPQYPLDKGVAETVDWYKKEGWL